MLLDVQGYVVVVPDFFEGKALVPGELPALSWAGMLGFDRKLDMRTDKACCSQANLSGARCPSGWNNSRTTRCAD